MAKQPLKPAASAGNKAGKSPASSGASPRSTISARSTSSQPTTPVKTPLSSSSKAANKRAATSGKQPLDDSGWSKTPKGLAADPASGTPARRGCLHSLLPMLLIMVGLAATRARRSR